MRSLYKFFRLQPVERKLFLEAVFSLYKIKFLLQIISFKRLRAQCTAKRTRDLSLAEVEDCRLAISRAKKLTFWRQSACLVDALSLQQMLARRGIASTLHLGVAKEKHQISAHAWLEHDGLYLVGQKIKNQFTPVASFSSRQDQFEIESRI